jgi:hypothetical protein
MQVVGGASVEEAVWGNSQGVSVHRAGRRAAAGNDGVPVQLLCGHSARRSARRAGLWTEIQSHSTSRALIIAQSDTAPEAQLSNFST